MHAEALPGQRKTSGKGRLPKDHPRSNNPFRVYRFWLKRHFPLHLWDSFDHILHQATSRP